MRACATCPCDARVCTAVQRTLSVCVLWCMQTLFSRVGLRRVTESFGRGRQKCRTPTLRVDTFPPRSDHVNQHTTCLSFHRLSEGRRPAEDPGAPPLSAVCVSPSSQQPPGSGAAKTGKTPRLPTRLRKLHAANVKITCRKSLHLAGTPQLGKCRRKRPIYETSSKSAKIPQTSSSKTKPGNEGHAEGQDNAAASPKEPTGTSKRARSRNPNWQEGETPRGTQRRTEGGRGPTRRPPPPRRRTRRNLKGKNRTTGRRAEGREPRGRPRSKPPAPREKYCVSHRRTNVV